MLEVQLDMCCAMLVLLERFLIRFCWLSVSAIGLGNSFIVFLGIFEQWFRQRSL